MQSVISSKGDNTLSVPGHVNSMFKHHEWWPGFESGSAGACWTPNQAIGHLPKTELCQRHFTMAFNTTVDVMKTLQ